MLKTKPMKNLLAKLCVAACLLLGADLLAPVFIGKGGVL